MINHKIKKTMENVLNLDLTKRYTYADYLTWWDDKRRELIDGVIRTMSPAASSVHAGISSNIHYALKAHIKQNNGTCRIFSAPFDVRLFADRDSDRKDDNTVVQPDICVVCDRSKIDKRGCKGAPDLIVEILSPSSLKRDTVEKFPLYERAGVREYWLVDPNEPSVNVFILQSDGKYDAGTVYEEEGKDIPVAIFDGLTLQWDDVFDER
jgi:Uma2 family endonuclease